MCTKYNPHRWLIQWNVSGILPLRRRRQADGPPGRHSLLLKSSKSRKIAIFSRETSGKSLLRAMPMSMCSVSIFGTRTRRLLYSEGTGAEVRETAEERTCVESHARNRHRSFLAPSLVRSFLRYSGKEWNRSHFAEVAFAAGAAPLLRQKCTDLQMRIEDSTAPLFFAPLAFEAQHQRTEH